MNLGLLWGMILGTLVLSSHSVAAKKVNIMFVFFKCESDIRSFPK